MILHSSSVSAFSLQLKTKSKISINQLRATASWYSFALERRAKRVREREMSSRRDEKETERNLSWYSNRVWLNFNNFSTFCSLTFFCLLGPRHALITTYNVWVARVTSNGCTTQQDSSRLFPTRPLATPSTSHSAVAFDCRLRRWWLPRLTRLGHDLCGPKKRKLCANLL